ncbi:MAG: tyrosine-type recombinase/integrase [Alphaproteobacteria bacterium]|nr:tyrosine-type recombinase/integrase [Alphaproteobacteria bacterium]
MKGWLLDRSAEILAEVIAEKARTEASRLEAKGEYGEMTLQAFVERIYGPVRWTEHPKSEEREKWQWNRIYDHLGAVKVKNLNLHRWTMFLMSQGTWSPRSKQICQVIYRGALKYAAEIGAIPEPHPFRSIKGGNKRYTPPGESLSAEEVALVLEAASTPMHRALFATAIGQGTRPGEVTTLDWSDVDWEGVRIRFRGAGKNLQAREWVPLTPLTRRELERHWLDMGEPEEGPVFMWKGKPFKSWRGSWKTAIKNSGIDPDGTRRLMPYSARYTYATLAAVAGVPRAAVRAGMRHSTSSRILETVYERLQDEQVANALEAFPACDIA